MRIRQGRKNPRNLYIQLGDKPSDSDVSMGYIRYPQWAKTLVDAVNGSPGGVGQSFSEEASWDRAEEVRTDRLGPTEEDVKNPDDPERPGNTLS